MTMTLMDDGGISQRAGVYIICRRGSGIPPREVRGSSNPIKPHVLYNSNNNNNTLDGHVHANKRMVASTAGVTSLTLPLQRPSLQAVRAGAS